jgi:hypothetical protein
MLGAIIVAYLIGLPFYLWYCIYQVNKMFWSKRNIDKSIPIVKTAKITPIKEAKYEPRAGGKIKFKPVVKTDANLYELENNPQ